MGLKEMQPPSEQSRKQAAGDGGLENQSIKYPEVSRPPHDEPYRQYGEDHRHGDE